MTQDKADVVIANNAELHEPADDSPKPAVRRPRRRACPVLGRRGQRGKRRGPVEKRRGPKEKRRSLEEKKKEGVTVKKMWSGGKRQYCVFCGGSQVKIARHLLRKHADEAEVTAASSLPTGSRQRHLLLEHLRCRGNYLHNIEVIREGSGEIVPCRQPSEEVDARNYLPCPLCLGFFLRSDLWKHQASCRKKLAADSASGAESSSRSRQEAACESIIESLCDRVEDGTRFTEDAASDRPGAAVAADQSGCPEAGSKRPMAAECSGDQNPTSDPCTDRPRKRSRVQAAASRLLPISGGASESCSEILHRMNQDHISHQVKSDWLICKYGTKLMGNQDGSRKRYDYVSQKLRELGRFLLAAKSLDSDVQTLLDVLVPGRLSLALAAARKASGYRWSRPPLAVKTTLKTVCEIAIGESLQNGDWEAAAITTDFYHMLGREWDNLGLMNPDTEGQTRPKTRLVQCCSKKSCKESDMGSEDPSKNSYRPLATMVSPDSRLKSPITITAAPRKVQRRPWSPAEKEAVWRQLGVHVLVQTVPGKEVCQRCLDLEPVLRGRHWKDIKNQVHNQIQSQKKQQFHAQMDLQENQEQQNQEPPDQVPMQKKQHQHYQAHIDQQAKGHNQNRKKEQCQVQMDQEDQGDILNHNKQLYHLQMDHQDHLQIHKKQTCTTRLEDDIHVHKKQLCQTDQHSQGPQPALDRDTSLMAGAPYVPDGTHRAPGLTLVEREPVLSPYPLPPKALGAHLDQLLSRTEWPSVQNYPVLQEAPPGGPPPHPHTGQAHFCHPGPQPPPL